MNRWTVFDEAAAALARERSSQVELRSGNDAGAAVSEALEQCGRVIAVFPARTADKAVVLRIEQRAAQAAAPSPAPAAAPSAAPQPTAAPAPAGKPEPNASYAAGGFLGLSDEIVLEEEPPKPKKWWQKILAD